MLVCNAKSVLDINHWFLPAKQAMLEMPGNLHHSKMCKNALSILSVPENKCWWEKRRHVNTNGI